MYTSIVVKVAIDAATKIRVVHVQNGPYLQNIKMKQKA